MGLGPCLRYRLMVLGMGASVLSCTSSPTPDLNSAISYDPNLRPSQAFFNPDAAWVEKWETTPPPEATKIAEAEVRMVPAGQKMPQDDIPWAVVKNDGQTETLKVGQKPAEVLIPPPPPVVALNVESTPTKTLEVAQIEESQIPPTQPPATDIPSELPRATESPRVKGPLPGHKIAILNSLAVDSVRLRQYYMRIYSWERPKAATTPFNAKGEVMNAFFFVRRYQENWTDLAAMIYGSPEKAEQLKDWNNGKHLRIGEIVYYHSPNRTNDDTRMLSITEDFGRNYESIVAAKGESLTEIAQRHYGAWHSWTEIAFFNQLQNAHRIAEGQKLKVQPHKLGLTTDKTPPAPASIPASDPASSNDSTAHE